MEKIHEFELSKMSFLESLEGGVINKYTGEVGDFKHIGKLKFQLYYLIETNKLFHIRYWGIQPDNEKLLSPSCEEIARAVLAAMGFDNDGYNKLERLGYPAFRNMLEGIFSKLCWQVEGDNKRAKVSIWK